MNLPDPQEVDKEAANLTALLVAGGGDVDRLIRFAAESIAGHRAAALETRRMLLSLFRERGPTHDVQRAAPCR